MQFKEGATVVSQEGNDVGEIDRVVIDPDTNQVTHLVVQEGFLFTEDKVVPISMVDQATEERVTLRASEETLDELPKFEGAHYVPMEEASLNAPPSPSYAASPLYWYPPIGVSWRTMWGDSGLRVRRGEPEHVVRRERNIPEGTVALDEGANVVSRDGEHVGDVERVFTDSQSDRATHLLISEGLLLKEKKLIPTHWMREVMENQVHLSVDAEFVDNLPEFELQQ